MSVIEQTGQSWFGKVQSVSFVRKAGYLVSDKRVTRSQPPPLFLLSGDVPRFSDQPKVYGREEEASSRMYDDGCPNENSTVDDATGYSREEEETLEEGAFSEEGKLYPVANAVSYGSSTAHFRCTACVEPEAGFFQGDLEKGESSCDSMLGERSAIEDGSSDPYLETDCDGPPTHVASKKTSGCVRL